MSGRSIRIATRASKLALWQASFIKSQLEKKYPNIKISLIEIITEGDKEQGALINIGGKSVFVKALQNALFNNEADIAVHSIKDMSVHDTEGLRLAAIYRRGDARDAFVSNNYSDMNALPCHAIIGTSSPRRTSLIKSLRPDIRTQLLRGNVDTRLLKLDEKNYDAIILAAAGLQRLNLSSRIRSYFSEKIFTPAIAQGAIGIEARSDDHFMLNLLEFLNDSDTEKCVLAERCVNRILEGDCHTAIGAHAKIINDKLFLSAMVGSLDGKIILRANADDDFNMPEKIGEKVAKDLISQGAEKLIHC